MLARIDPRDTAGEILAFLLAASCAGCDAPGLLLCDDCRTALAPRPIDLRSPAGLPVRAALPFEGVAARCIRRLKDEGETLLVRPLGRALAGAMDASAPSPADHLAMVPVPTSRAAFRRRGYRVPDLLIRAAGASPRPVLTRRRHADQRGLSIEERAANARGTMRARGAGAGIRAVVIDDVVTTGATLDEAARALGRAGYHVVGAFALAATPRLSERWGNASETRSK